MAVVTDRLAAVSARIARIPHRLHLLEAELTQEHMTVARVQGKFFDCSVVVGALAE
jgi:hypothetical protein